MAKNHFVNCTDWVSAKYVEGCLSCVLQKNGADRMEYSCSYVTKFSYASLSLCFHILCQ